MHFVGPPREADGNDGNAREERITLPRLERNGGQQIVFTEHDVGHLRVSGGDGLDDSNDARSIDAELPEEPFEVVAQVAMATDAQSLQFAALSRHW